MKDNPSLLIVWFVFSYCTDQTHCGHLAEPISAIHKKKMLFFKKSLILIFFMILLAYSLIVYIMKFNIK